ncbi:sigma-70 family RNA polymerase sigma factor [Nocardiopsis mangrovi]|uniref:Sigma-70 family RNA polymerase sigma factor n=1 Tax=Nocardiopsis mangrovi TaxID=1179818 RepID=A0ABV9DWZ7_9ACTN
MTTSTDLSFAAALRGGSPGPLRCSGSRLAPGPVPPDRSRELDLLAREARSGHPAALNALFALTREDVRRFIARRVDPEWVDDLTQETYTRATRSMPRFAGRAPVRAWLFSVARHTVADRYRTQNSRPRPWSLADLDGASRRTPPEQSRFDEYIALSALLDELRPDRRSAFVLTQLHGFTYVEAAEIAGVPVGTVRSRVARARRDLLTLLNAPA